MTYDADSIDNRRWESVERVVSLLEPWLRQFFHPVIHGLDRIPPGPVLYVANHNGGVLFPDAKLQEVATSSSGMKRDGLINSSAEDSPDTSTGARLVQHKKRQLPRA